MRGASSRGRADSAAGAPPTSYYQPVEGPKIVGDSVSGEGRMIDVLKRHEVQVLRAGGAYAEGNRGAKRRLARTVRRIAAETDVAPIVRRDRESVDAYCWHLSRGTLLFGGFEVEWFDRSAGTVHKYNRVSHGQAG